MTPDRTIALLLCSAILFAARGPAVADSTFLVMRSQPGDYIGMGETYRFTDADARFSVDRNDNGAINVSVDSTSDFWHLSFAPPQGSDLEPNFYDSAGSFPFQSPTEPGIGLGGDGRGCDGAGRFYVLEIALGAAGQVERFTADFEHHCGIGGAATFGTIGFHSTLPVPGETVSASPDPSTTYLLLDSDPGEFIGGGVRRLLTPADGKLAISQSFGGALVTFQGDTHWSVLLQVPEGRDLAPGFYDGAQRAAFRDPDAPGLEATGQHNGCNTITGWFAVYVAEFGPGGEFGRFAADFEQHCEGGVLALRGMIRVNSSFPAGVCPGDCNDDGRVSIDELTMGVGIAIETAPLRRCLPFDADSTERVSIDELVTAVNAALNGCPGEVAWRRNSTVRVASRALN